MNHKKVLSLCFSTVVLVTVLAMLLCKPGVVGAKLQQSQQTAIFPPLTGHYQVGKVDYDLVDTSRREIFIDNPQAKREILMTVYYPAIPSEGAQPAPFLDGKTLETFAQVYNVPASFITDHIHSHSFAAAPLAKAKKQYPVLIFSPGWGTNPLYNFNRWDLHASNMKKYWPIQTLNITCIMSIPTLVTLFV